ncbi:MAG: hypothetical protein JRJ85_28255, partial [Deltaproteobacteria bacterium]|nr:hypothetical protein [Deltaproteobacteria bacterium]
MEFRHEEAGGGDNYYLRWKGPDSLGAWVIVPAGSFTALTRTTYLLETAATPASTITDYVVKVVVGDSSMPEPNCKQYPNGTYKPTGILQTYGEPGRMYFGLLTGSYDDNTQGGILRKQIGSITDEIDSSTGQLTSVNGIIKTIDNMRISEFRYSDFSYEPGWAGAWVTTRSMNAGEFPDWGNPIAEMMYEGMRYFAGKGTATSAFTDATSTVDSSLGLPEPSWGNPYNADNYCAKPFMLVLSDIYPTYDSDDLPGSYFNPGFSGTLGTLDVEDLADTILSEEGDAGNHYIGRLGATYDGSCAPKDMDGFGDVRGLCPEEPTKQGSYYAASVAYYGRNSLTNPVVTTETGDPDAKLEVLSYMVALASALPRIEIPVAGQTVTLVPFAKSIGGCLGIVPTQGTFQPTNTIVDFFVEAITPTSGTFRINYEDVEQAADHDMDAIVTYEYQVIDDAGDPVAQSADGTKVKITLSSDYASGGINQHLGYIISGTTADGTYLEVVDADIAGTPTPGTDV